MAYQINLTGQEIDERLQNVGTAEDKAAADGTLYARSKKNADDIDELNDTVLHIQDAQTATDKTVTQHTSDISALQTAVGNNKTEQDAIAQKVEKNATAIAENTKGVADNKAKVENVEKVVNKHSDTLLDHEKRLSDVEELVHRGLPVYGVEWDVNQTSPDVKRIGIPELHRTLPCHQLRGCLLADNGTVNEYLPQDDWTSATRDGSKGQVMVEIPEMWMTFEIDGDMRRVLLSPVAIGGFKHYQKRYVSAYEATVQRSTNKLASVVNTAEDYRGGRNDASLDGTAYTLLGKPAGGYFKNTYRTYARNRFPSVAWNMYVYDVHCQLTWLFVVEYATLNSQKAYNAELTADGYHQGGLGNGVTNMTYKEQEEFQNSPVVACGYTDGFGNNTGVKDISIALSGGDKIFSVCRYRGVENIIGNLSAIVDGLWLKANGAAFVKTEAATFTSTMPSDSELTCWRRSEGGYIRNIDDSAFVNGWSIPKAIGGNDKTYYCDSNALNQDTDELCAYLGGGKTSFNSAGLFFFGSMSLTRTDSNIGTRLCYLPQKDNSGTLRDLYISAGAVYNEATGFYELNGLTDITEEEMRVIYNRYLIDIGSNNSASGWLLLDEGERTNLPCITRADIFSHLDNAIKGYKVEVLRICAADANDYRRVCYVSSSAAVAHYEMPKLKKVIGIWRYNSSNPNDFDFGYGQPFSKCPLLEEIRMTKINKSHTFAVSPNLSKESVQYMIENANPPSGAAVGSITITLHPTAYARLKDDADIVAALEAKGGIVVLISA